MAPRSFTPAYLAGEPAAQRFLSADFLVSTARVRAVAQAAARSLDPALLSELHRQQSALPPSPARDEHLRILAQGGAAVVITGQQVGLYLGPTYTFYKALTAVAVARALSAESGRPVVPLFWLQTEDHDFAEIASCALPGEGEDITTLGLTSAPPERTSLAHYRLGAEIKDINARLASSLRALPAGHDVAGLFARHYTEGTPIGDAFARVLAEVFAPEGLLVFNPRTEAVARLAAPVHERALTSCGALDQALQERDAALRAAGFKPQVKLRAGCALSFFHAEGAEGPRHRLQHPRADRWTSGGSGGSFTTEDLTGWLAQEPLRFSTSSLLRPLLQDRLFPTAAVIGGPAEIAYFAQLAPLYAHFELPVPMVLPRWRCEIVEPSVQRALQALQLTPADAAASDAQVSLADSTLQALRDDITAQCRAALERATPHLDEPALERTLRGAQQRVERQIERLMIKMGRAKLRKNEQARARLQLIRNRLRPHGKPQERVYAVPYFAARYGFDELKRAVSSADCYHAQQRTLQPHPLPSGAA